MGVKDLISQWKEVPPKQRKGSCIRCSLRKRRDADPSRDTIYCNTSRVGPKVPWATKMGIKFLYVLTL